MSNSCEIARLSPFVPAEAGTQALRAASCRPGSPPARGRTELIAALFALGVLGCATAAAQGTLFQGKTVTVIVGYPAGGGTDTLARLVAGSLASHLPASPTVIVRNVPGADGITAMNYFVEQVAADGYTLAVNASTTADPLNWRKPQARFDPTKFAVVGGAGRGGVLL